MAARACESLREENLKRKQLDDQARTSALAALNAEAQGVGAGAEVRDTPWRVEQQKKLMREFKFVDFTAAFAFMSGSALAAEKLDHHPEWFNVYNRVDVVLTTHDADGLTELDFALAATMNRLASALS